MSKTNTKLIDLDAVLIAKDIPHDVPVSFDEHGVPQAGFKVFDANSERYRETKRAVEIKAVMAGANRGKGVDTKTETGAKTVLDVQESTKRALVKGCIESMYGLSVGGKPAEPTDEVLEKIFARFPILVDRLAAKIDEGAGFLKV